MNPNWGYAIGQSPDGWLVMYLCAGGDESDEEILAHGLANAAHFQADPATVRVVRWYTQTPEEHQLLLNFLAVWSGRVERGEV